MKSVTAKVFAGFCVCAFSLSPLRAAAAKPTIVELINKLKPDSLRNEKGKWLQTWLDDPGFDDKGLAQVDLANAYVSIVDPGTGAGMISHEFAAYYPQGAGAILVHYYENDQGDYISDLKFYQLRQEKLEPIASLLPPLICRDFATDAAKKVFYQNAGIAGLKSDPVLPSYSIPRQGTTISAYCDASKNRFNIERPLGEQPNLSQEAKTAIINAVEFPFRIDYTWNNKKGSFAVGKKHPRK